MRRTIIVALAAILTLLALASPASAAAKACTTPPDVRDVFRSVAAGESTSCALAVKVARRATRHPCDGILRVASPVTKRTYSLRCSAIVSGWSHKWHGRGDHGSTINVFLKSARPSS